MGLANVQDNPLDPGNSNRRPGTPCRPVRRMMRLRRIQRVPRPLSETQVEQLLAATAGARDRAILLLMLQGGLRPGEVLNLHLEDVQYGRRRVVVRNRTDHPKGVRSKARSERIVDLHEPETLAAVSAYVMGERPPDATASQLVLIGGDGAQRGEPLGYSGLAKWFRRCCRRAGLTEAGSPCTRCATRTRRGSGGRHARACSAATARPRLVWIDEILHAGIRRRYARGLPPRAC